MEYLTEAELFAKRHKKKTHYLMTGAGKAMENKNVYVHDEFLNN